MASYQVSLTRWKLSNSNLQNRIEVLLDQITTLKAILDKVAEHLLLVEQLAMATASKNSMINKIHQVRVMFHAQTTASLLSQQNIQ